jgi:hypothetical protein
MLGRSAEGAWRSEVRAEDVDLGDDGVVRVMQRDQLVALVGKRSPGPGEIGTHRFLAVIDIAGGDELVAWMPNVAIVASKSQAFSDVRCSCTTASRCARRSLPGAATPDAPARSSQRGSRRCASRSSRPLQDRRGALRVPLPSMQTEYAMARVGVACAFA